MSAPDPPPPRPELSIVIPLFNEEENVGPMVEEVIGVFEPYRFELILVDDGSTDATADRVPRNEPRIRLLRLAENTGQSAAMYAGIMAAAGDRIVLLDGDLQNDPADAPKLLAELDRGADLACGYRANRKDTAFKRFQSRIANAVRSRFTGDGVRDTGCTLKAMRRECRDALVPFTGMHRFIPALIKGAGFRLAEVPVNHRPRHTGSSKYGGGLKRTIPATLDMFGVRWLLGRRFTIRFRGSDGAA